MQQLAAATLHLYLGKFAKVSAMQANRSTQLIGFAKSRPATFFAGTQVIMGDRFQIALDQTRSVYQSAAQLTGAFLAPVSLLAYAFAAWSLGSDIGWMGEFPVPGGLFSHWLVWVALGLAIQSTGSMLQRPVAATAKTPEPVVEEKRTNP